MLMSSSPTFRGSWPLSVMPNTKWSRLLQRVLQAWKCNTNMENPPKKAGCNLVCKRLIPVLDVNMYICIIYDIYMSIHCQRFLEIRRLPGHAGQSLVAGRAGRAGHRSTLDASDAIDAITLGSGATGDGPTSGNSGAGCRFRLCVYRRNLKKSPLSYLGLANLNTWNSAETVLQVTPDTDRRLSAIIEKVIRLMQVGYTIFHGSATSRDALNLTVFVQFSIPLTLCSFLFSWRMTYDWQMIDIMFNTPLFTTPLSIVSQHFRSKVALSQEFQGLAPQLSRIPQQAPCWSRFLYDWTVLPWTS